MPPINDEDPRLVGYRLGKLEEAVTALVSSATNLQQTFVRMDNYRLRDEFIERRFNEIDERLDKISRAVLTFITSVAATVVAAVILFFIFGKGA